jgi:hypothetical protein
MSVRDELIAAKALIDAPHKWCKDEGYVWRGFNLPFAAKPSVQIDIKHCALFALNAVHASRSTHRAALMQVPRAFGSVNEFNDDPRTTHADIMAMFDRAIEAA